MSHVTLLKRTALKLGFAAGLFELTRIALRRRQATILVLHRFSGNGEGHPDGVPIGRLAELMAYLSQHYRVVSLSELTEDLRRGLVRPFTVAVTVDDGYHEFFTLAAPVFRRYQIPASVFVVSGFIDGRLWPWTDRFAFVFDHTPCEHLEFRHRGARHVLDLRLARDRQKMRDAWIKRGKRRPVAEREHLLEVIAEAAGVDIPAEAPREYRAMTWDQLRVLAAEGFDVGGHTCTHPILSWVSPDQVRIEIESCKEQIEQQLGSRIRHFAYPNGRGQDYTPEAVAAAARAGYVAAVTSVPGVNTPLTSPFELRRLAVGPESVAHFAQSVSGFALLRQGLLEADLRH